jgi:hypothetical protein
MTKRRGSCLCGNVRFAVSGTVDGVGQCHCSQCRKVSGTNGNAVFLVSSRRFEWLSGEEHTYKFSLPSGWSVLRCKTCGSPLPQSHDGKRVWVIAGLMDDDLETEIRRHIFCGSRADWDRSAADSEEFEEWPVPNPSDAVP